MNWEVPFTVCKTLMITGMSWSIYSRVTASTLLASLQLMESEIEGIFGSQVGDGGSTAIPHNQGNRSRRKPKDSIMVREST